MVAAARETQKPQWDSGSGDAVWKRMAEEVGDSSGSAQKEQKKPAAVSPRPAIQLYNSKFEAPRLPSVERPKEPGLLDDVSKLKGLVPDIKKSPIEYGAQTLALTVAAPAVLARNVAQKTAHHVRKSSEQKLWDHYDQQVKETQRRAREQQKFDEAAGAYADRLQQVDLKAAERALKPGLAEVFPHSLPFVVAVGDFKDKWDRTAETVAQRDDLPEVVERVEKHVPFADSRILTTVLTQDAAERRLHRQLEELEAIQIKEESARKRAILTEFPVSGTIEQQHLFLEEHQINPRQRNNFKNLAGQFQKENAFAQIRREAEDATAERVAKEKNYEKALGDFLDVLKDCSRPLDREMALRALKQKVYRDGLEIRVGEGQPTMGKVLERLPDDQVPEFLVGAAVLGGPAALAALDRRLTKGNYPPLVAAVRREGEQKILTAVAEDEIFPFEAARKAGNNEHLYPPVIPPATLAALGEVCQTTPEKLQNRAKVFEDPQAREELNQILTTLRTEAAERARIDPDEGALFALDACQKAMEAAPVKPPEGMPKEYTRLMASHAGEAVMASIISFYYDKPDARTAEGAVPNKEAGALGARIAHCAMQNIGPGGALPIAEKVNIMLLVPNAMITAPESLTRDLLLAPVRNPNLPKEEKTSVTHLVGKWLRKAIPEIVPHSSAEGLKGTIFDQGVIDQLGKLVQGLPQGQLTFGDKVTLPMFEIGAVSPNPLAVVEDPNFLAKPPKFDPKVETLEIGLEANPALTGQMAAMVIVTGMMRRIYEDVAVHRNQMKISEKQSQAARAAYSSSSKTTSQVQSELTEAIVYQDHQAAMGNMRQLATALEPIKTEGSMAQRVATELCNKVGLGTVNNVLTEGITGEKQPEITFAPTAPDQNVLRFDCGLLANIQRDLNQPDSTLRAFFSGVDIKEAEVRGIRTVIAGKFALVPDRLGDGKTLVSAHGYSSAQLQQLTDSLQPLISEVKAEMRADHLI